MRAVGRLQRTYVDGERKVVLECYAVPEMVTEAVMNEHLSWAMVMRAVMIACAREVSDCCRTT